MLLRATLVLLLLTPLTGFGRSYELDLLGISYHLDPNGAYKGAPRGLDPNGQGVFNPGIGLGVTFLRNSVHDSGFFPSVKGGMFQDCDDRTLVYAGGGVKYLTPVAGMFVVGGGLSLFIANGENWNTAERIFVLVPYPSVEAGVILADQHSLSLNISFAPGGSGISALSSSSLLFFTLSFSYFPSAL